MAAPRLSALGAAVLLAFVATSPRSNAQGGPVSLDALDAPYTQDFNTLASSATSNALPAGWRFAETGSNANLTYSAGTGSSAAGDTYSFGAAASSERALGGLQSGTLVPTVGALFVNNTGQTITSLTIAYTGEQWRLGFADRPDRLDFQYRIDASDLTSGVWLDADILDFTSPITSAPTGPLDGQSPANRTSLDGTIAGLSIAPGTPFALRWSDFNATNADDGLAIDDFSITPHGGGAPTLSVNDVSIAEGNAGTFTAAFTVTVSSATHTGVTFDIATADGTGPLAATAGGGDYVPRADSGVSIPQGATTFMFEVTVNGDTNLEPDETFFVRISSVLGAALIDGEGVGTIANDDEPPPVDTDVVISQVYGGGGNAGTTLTHDFIELFNRGATPVSLAGWSVQYSPPAGTGTWLVTPLNGFIAPGGYYLIQEAAGAGGTAPLPTPDANGSIAMGATAGKVALQITTTAIVGQCPSGLTADLVGYGTATCFEGMGPAAPPPDQTSNTTAALRKRGGCIDSDNNFADFLIGGPSPRNSAAPAKNCTPAPATIHEIQGSGPMSPLVGQDVIASGVVTGVKSNGFFMQSADTGADADPATSEGVFVFTAVTPAVAAGNEVSARGTVGEFFGLTQIESTVAGDVTVTTPVAPLPTSIVLTTDILDSAGTLDQLERFEGMRLHAASLTSVAPTNEFGEIAAVLTGVPRPLREPGISVLAPVPPDPTSGAPDCCIPRFDENPERILLDTEGLIGTTVLPVTSNVVITNVTGPLDFSFGAYKILPEFPPTASANMSGVPVPAASPDEFTVGGFNIENFANNETRRRKAALAVRLLMRSPDVIGHIEILDLATLQSLADQINADTIAAGQSDPGYQAVLIPAPDGGTQNVGFIVKTSRVRIDAVSQERASDTFINPISQQAETLHDRPPLVLRATFDPLGLNPRRAIVVVNHLRSFIDIELVGGQGPRVRAKRKAQAESVAGLLQELQTLEPDIPIISVGDYNAYQFSDGYTDPIGTLKGAPTPDDQIVVDESPDLVDPNFVNLTDTLLPQERYSFIFEGTPQALDHVLVNTVAAAYAGAYAIARGNSDFPDRPSSLFADDASRPERSSDHDMPVAFFRFPPPTADVRVAMTADVASAEAGAQVSYVITVTNDGVAPAQNVIVTDHLPPTLTVVSCAATGGAACVASPGGPTATFPLLPPGSSETVTITALVGCGAPNESLIANAATATSDATDPSHSNNSASALVTATNPAPTLTGASASRTQLFLALHQMVPVTIDYMAADACGPVTTTLGVTSDEAVTAPVRQQGLAGLTSPDWRVVGPHEVLLRAERSIRGDGRVYTITITATDEAGGATTQQLTVMVPRISF